MSITAYLIFVLFGSTFSIQLPVPIDYIVGGSQASIESFPYQLSVRIDGRHKCGGSIISSQWALSAAHCFINVQPSDVTFRAGSTISTSGGILVAAQSIYTHPDFNLKNGDFDVAIVLASDIFSGPNIGSIGLPAAGTLLPIDSTAVISGWGLTSASDMINPIYLQSVAVTILTRSVCVQDYESLGGVDDMMFCAGQTGHDSCQGDSGGPIVVSNIQVGTVSGGIGCANPKYPGLYTNIADPRIRNWITQVASI